MRILYLSLSYVPSRRASSVHVMRMCSALARRGDDVVLVTKACAARQEAGVDDDFAFYGVAPDFRLLKLPRPAWRGGGVVWLAATRAYLRRHRAAIDLVYARDLPGAWLAGRLGLPVVFEAHAPPRGWLGRQLLGRLVDSGRLRRLVAISGALAERLRAEWAGAGDLPLLVAHDAADPMAIEAAAPAADPGPAKLAYVGQLHRGKGLETVRRLAAAMPDLAFHVVGGSEKELARARARPAPPNLVFEGFVRPADLASRYRRFDVLLLPCERRVHGASGGEISRWMSPMKLFEYLAAGRAIVSSDLPVLREVLEHERNALLVPAEDTGAWSAALRRLLGDPDLGGRLARQAQADLLERYTWDTRARAVLDGI